MRQQTESKDLFIKYPTILLYNTTISDRTVRILLYIIYRKGLEDSNRVTVWKVYLSDIKKQFKGHKGYSECSIRRSIKELVSLGILKFIQNQGSLDHYQIDAAVLEIFYTQRGISHETPPITGETPPISHETPRGITGETLKKREVIENNIIEKSTIEKKPETPSNVKWEVEAKQDTLREALKAEAQEIEAYSKFGTLTKLGGELGSGYNIKSSSSAIPANFDEAFDAIFKNRNRN